MSFSIVRVAFVFALFGIGAAHRAAQGAVFSEFNIRIASNPAAVGGVFTDDGTFFGSFVIDQTAYAASDFAHTIVSWDIATTPGTLGRAAQYKSSEDADYATFDVVQTIFQPEIGENFYIEKLFSSASARPSFWNCTSSSR